MYELFMDIEGYEGKYQVSNLGNVKNIKTGRLLKSYKSNKGYLQVDLYKNGVGKKYYVHRLVIATFKANPDNKPQVNHINEDKTDNRLNNLEWCTSKENNNHGTKNKRATSSRRRSGQYTRMSRKVICVETKKVYNSIVDAAKDINFSNPPSISKCCNGKQVTAGGYHWKYYE